MAYGVFPIADKMLLDTGIEQIGFLTTTNSTPGNYWFDLMTENNWRSYHPEITWGLFGISCSAKLQDILTNHTTTWTKLFTLKNGNSLCAKYSTPLIGDIGFSYMDKQGNVYNADNGLGFEFVEQYKWMAEHYTNVTVCLFPIRSYNNKLGFGCVAAGYQGSTLWLNLGWNFFDSVNTMMLDFLNGQPVDLDDPYVTSNDDNPTGGYGGFDYTSEVETPPSLPSLSAANAGFVTLWNPSIGEVGSLADYLWGPTFSVASWQKLWNDPMECLLSLGIVPVAPTTGTRSNIYFGNADTGIESAPITTQFVSVDMGSIRIDGQSASYMDYAPYAKASIYLPYCGTYALDVDEVMDADLALEYHIDIYTGACVAYLTIDNRTNSDGSNVHSVMYQFTGNCLASIPVTSGDHSQLLQSLLFMGASIAATVATAGAGAASGGAIEGLAAEGDVVASSGVMGAATAGSAINTVMSMKPNVMHSGNLSSTAGLLGGQKPFVTFTWSNLCRPEGEYKLVGMPIQKSGTLSDFEGFTIVSACHMDNILCTDAERSMIEQALGRGVII